MAEVWPFPPASHHPKQRFCKKSIFWGGVHLSRIPLSGASWIPNGELLQNHKTYVIILGVCHAGVRPDPERRACLKHFGVHTRGTQPTLASPQRPLLLEWLRSHLAALSWHPALIFLRSVLFCYSLTCLLASGECKGSFWGN